MPLLNVDPGTLKTSVIPEGREKKSIVSQWVGQVTDTVAQGDVQLNGQSGPTVSARFYSMAGTAMYEAWQAFNSRSESVLGADYSQAWDANSSSKPSIAIIESAVSKAAFKVLSDRSSGITNRGRRTISDFYRDSASDLSIEDQEIVDDISRVVSQAVLSEYRRDGFNKSINYKPINSGPDDVNLIDRWTPEYQVSDDPTSGLQSFLTPQWGNVKPLGLTSEELSAITDQAKVPEPFLLDQDDTYDLQDGLIFTSGSSSEVKINRNAIGSYINPAFIDQAKDVLSFSQKLTPDKAGRSRKGSAEFWEDGPGTPFPPGTWMVFGQYASLAENFNLGEDAKLFLGIGASVHSAGISAWDLKANQDYARPVRVIRELSRLNLLPDADDATKGSQFRAYNRKTGQVDLITGSSWETYQKEEGGYSPPFAEYTSGHSTFSAAAAEFLTNFTGSKKFGGDVSFNLSFGFPNGGPTQLKWKTWEDAASDAGISRLWGGIHFQDGNLEGLRIGRDIGSRLHENLSSVWG